MDAPDAFRSFASLLSAVPQLETPAAPLEREPAAATAELSDLRLFRAHIEEAARTAVQTIVTDVAASVLARELELAPADITAIVERIIAEYFTEEPLRVRVNPGEVEHLRCDLPVLGDESLLPGDAVLELRNGFAIATLGARLDALLGPDR